MKQLFAICIWVCIVAALYAQPDAKPPVEMAKLDFLLGDWHGKGWAQLGPNQRSDFDITEKAYKKVGAGHVFVVEGLGTFKSADGKRDMIGHEAFGVVSYDAMARKYMIRAFRRDGSLVDAELTVAGKSIQWGFKDPKRNVEVRFVIRLNDKNQWHESGEVSLDGKTWRKFLDMTLDKVK